MLTIYINYVLFFFFNHFELTIEQLIQPQMNTVSILHIYECVCVCVYFLNECLTVSMWVC